MKSFLTIFAAAFMLGLPSAADAQNTGNAPPQQEAEKIPVVKIVLHPMAEPRPALKYQLLPPLIDRKPGNAAVLYNRIPAERDDLFSNGKWDEIVDLMEAPLADLRREESRKVIDQFSGVVRDTIRAAHYESCDWQLPIRDEPFWQILLPEVQQSRNYGRLLAVHAKLQIADGKYDEAIQTMQAGYAFARHVAAGQTLVNGLVGKTIAGMMSYQLRELIQQPDAPNLYWALSSLPRPIVDFRPGFDAEYDSVYLSNSKLRDLDKKILTTEEARRLLMECVNYWNQLSNLISNAKLPNGVETPLETIAVLLSDYPASKRLLLERGFSADNLESMPVAQVVLIAILRRYDEARDNFFKWAYTSNVEALGGTLRAERAYAEKSKTEEVLFSLERILLPSLRGVVVAGFTSEREIAALEVLEALRIFAAGHDGRLPERLSDITEVPVPLDPTQGKPFFYHGDWSTATLESPNPPNTPLERYLKYEIQMLPKGN